MLGGGRQGHLQRLGELADRRARRRPAGAACSARVSCASAWNTPSNSTMWLNCPLRSRSATNWLNFSDGLYCEVRRGERGGVMALSRLYVARDGKITAVSRGRLRMSGADPVRRNWRTLIEVTAPALRPETAPRAIRRRAGGPPTRAGGLVDRRRWPRCEAGIAVGGAVLLRGLVPGPRPAPPCRPPPAPRPRRGPVPVGRPRTGRLSAGRGRRRPHRRHLARTGHAGGPGRRRAAAGRGPVGDLRRAGPPPGADRSTRRAEPPRLRRVPASDRPRASCAPRCRRRSSACAKLDADLARRRVQPAPGRGGRAATSSATRRCAEPSEPPRTPCATAPPPRRATPLARRRPGRPRADRPSRSATDAAPHDAPAR